MHLKLSTASFLDELQTAARVASTRSAVQALSGVQLHA
jgi:DNA polymerase III sliding clamp (beta) subunit (PCNA family)